MLAGGCLCGTVAFEVEGDCTTIEVCHCRRCRQAYGSGMAATVYARLEGFRWIRGAEAVKVYDAPLRERPPQYRHVFCETCGSPLPICREEFDFVEIPVGTLAEEPNAPLAYEIFTAQRLSWVTALGHVHQFAQAASHGEEIVRELFPSPSHKKSG
jgi:hypothetical protein